LIFTKTGHVGSGFYVLGTSPMPVYLLNSSRPVLFDCGLSCLGPVFERALRAELGQDAPRFLFLTHVHFDHCGTAAYLKKTFPDLKIAASRQGATIIQRPRAISLITQLNRAVAELVREWGVEGISEGAFEPFEVDIILEDGQELQIGDGLTLRAISTPGHTRDFMSYYIPEKKILIGSEAVGCASLNGYVEPDCLVDYDAFLSSLIKLSKLEVEILAQGHHFVYTGGDVARHFERSIESTANFKNMVLDFWGQEKGDLDRVMTRIRAIEYDPQPPPKQLEQAYLINLKARIRAAGKGLIEIGD
jgi:2-aminobenzoylacetyl-CoA thioesterase